MGLPKTICINVVQGRTEQRGPAFAAETQKVTSTQERLNHSMGARLLAAARQLSDDVEEGVREIGEV
eukprot:m.386359 g.386359  ORF g.386359 m.386359 type:complete len:67 (+) comp16745_c3_seq27:892-1092(+)